MPDVMKEAHAVRALVEAFDAAKDEEIRLALAEGETNLIEAITGVLVSLDDDAALVAGLKDRLKVLSERLRRVESRIEYKRAAIEQAMLIADLSTIETSVATVSLKKTPRQIVITDEAAIPSEFWKRGDPKLDRAALKEALQAAAVPGAALSNGGVAIQIRVS